MCRFTVTISASSVAVWSTVQSLSYLEVLPIMLGRGSDPSRRCITDLVGAPLGRSGRLPIGVWSGVEIPIHQALSKSVDHVCDVCVCAWCAFDVDASRSVSLRCAYNEAYSSECCCSFLSSCRLDGQSLFTCYTARIQISLHVEDAIPCSLKVFELSLQLSLATTRLCKEWWYKFAVLACIAEGQMNGLRHLTGRYVPDNPREKGWWCGKKSYLTP